MKRAALIFFGLVVGWAGLAAEPRARLTPDERDDLYARAVVLLAAGQHAAAEDATRALLAETPEAPAVIALHRKIQLERQAAARTAPQRGLEQRLKQIILKEVKFHNAPPRAVIDWLRIEAAKQTTGQAPINFVWLPPADVALPTVSLTLQEIPLLEVIRYTTSAAGLRYHLEPHAVVIRLPEPPPPPSPNAAAD